MSTSSARLGLGTLLQIGDGATTEAFNTVGQVRNLALANRTRPTISTTHMQSTAAEFIGGLLDSGEVTGDFNLLGDDTYQNQMETDFEAGTCRNFKLVIPDMATSTYDFAGVITNLSDTYPVEDAMVRSFTVKVSGGLTKS